MTEEILRRTLRTVMSVEDNVRRLLARFPELRVASADGAVSWAVGRLYSDELLDAVSAGLAYLPACSMRADGAGTDELSETYERVLPGRVAMPRVWPRRVARLGSAPRDARRVRRVAADDGDVVLLGGRGRRRPLRRRARGGDSPRRVRGRRLPSRHVPPARRPRGRRAVVAERRRGVSPSGVRGVLGRVRETLTRRRRD